MPKQILKIDQFHGGLNDDSDPRDIADNELSEATDVMVDELGKIRTMGGTTSAHQNFSASMHSGGFGRGLFQFSSDYKGGDGNVADGAAETDYLAYYDHTNSQVDIFESGESAVQANQIDLGSDAYGKPTFYYVDGALRVSDGARKVNNINKWYGYIDRSYFHDNLDEKYEAWKAEDQFPAPPTAGRLLKHNGITLWSQAGGDPGAADGFLRMSISASSEADATNWIDAQAYNDSDIDTVWYTKSGGWDGDYSEDIDGSMGGGHSGTEYFATSHDDTNLSGSTVTVSVSNPSVPLGKASDSSPGDVIMKMVKVWGSRDYSRFKVKTDNSINLTDKSLFFDLYLSEHMATVLENLYVYIGTGMGNFTIADGGNWKRWIIPGSEILRGVGDWQEVEINVNTAAESVEGSPNLGAANHFAIQFQTINQGDKFGYVTGDASDGDCLIYNIRYGEPKSGNGWNGNYRFEYSWIYDGNQESDTFKFLASDGGATETHEFTGSSLFWRAHTKIVSAGGFNHASAGSHRITGANVYYMEQENSVDVSNDLYHLCTIDFEKGTKSSFNDAFSDWAETSGGSHEWESPGNNVPHRIDNPNAVDTFSLNSGRLKDYSLSNNPLKPIYFKTAVVANRMAYIANVKYTDINGNDHIKGDAILKSNVNAFDTFSSDRVIEASVSDGDSIVKLEEYADRLLEIGKKKMTLINISQEIEFLEETFLHKGVLHPASTCKTDFGIAWVNRQGCYLYDGQKVNNLFEKSGRQIIKQSIFDSWSTTSLGQMIGYIPKKRQLIIRNNQGNSGIAGNIYLYDMVTTSWVTGGDKLPSDDSTAEVTNFITDWNNDLVFAHSSGTVVKWDDTSDSSSNISIKTKDIDFGQPGQRKKIYKVYVTYTGGISGPQPEITKVVCTADSSSNRLDGKYFDIDTHGGQKTEIWFDTDASGGAPTGTGSYNDTIEVTQVGTDDSAERVAVALASAINEDAGAHTTAKVEGDTVFITDAANAAVTSSTMSAGDTGFTVTQIQEGNPGTVAQNVDVTYRLNGTGSWLQFDNNLDASASSQTVATLTPSAAINNVYSIRLRFDGTAAANFEINDISIVFRVKPVK